jgi:hypothetical protein
LPAGRRDAAGARRDGAGSRREEDSGSSHAIQ